MSFFSNEIISWYEKNARMLPWRETNNAYLIWLSEIILQQTRVAQGLPYYTKFVQHFPDLESFANADENDILTLWQGLGYYSRARNMHKCAQVIQSEHNGVFPSSYIQLLKLPGIGPYTAAAIASFAFQESVAVVDGNVIRLVSRYLGIQEAVNEKSTLQKINNFVQREIKGEKPNLFNQSIMEMGSLICTPKLTKCNECCLALNCLALKQNKVKEIPFKSTKTKVRKRYFNYFIVEDQLHLNQRTGKGIWQNLYEFPMLESNRSENKRNAILVDTFNHQLSHQRIEAKLWIVNNLPSQLRQNKGIFEVALKDIGNVYPIHQLMNKMIKAWQEQ